MKNLATSIFIYFISMVGALGAESNPWNVEFFGGSVRKLIVPAYPTDAKPSDAEVEIPVTLSIDPQGNVLDCEIAQFPTDDPFVKSVKEALIQWKFHTQFTFVNGERKIVENRGAIVIIIFDTAGKQVRLIKM